MTITEFINSWSLGLDEYINTLAARYGRRPEDAEDYRAEAYLYLSLARNGLTDEEYKRIAYQAIQNLWRSYRKEDHLSFEDYFNNREY